MSAIWPKADICNERVNVRFRGKSGHFRHQSGHQILQVAKLPFHVRYQGKADMAFALQMSASTQSGHCLTAAASPLSMWWI